MASISIIDKGNTHKSHLRHFVVQTRSFQIEKCRDVDLYPRLRNYIRKQNEKRKQEMEMSEELKRAKREKELKHNQDKLTLGEIKEEIAKHELRLSELENEKHRLFAEFKKVLNEDDSRKNLQRQKEAANNITSMTFGSIQQQQQQHPAPPPMLHQQPPPHLLAPPPVSVATSLSSNSGSLKFGPPPPGPPPAQLLAQQHSLAPPPPPPTNPAVIPNSAMLSLQPPYFGPHGTGAMPPPPGLSSLTSGAPTGSSQSSSLMSSHRNASNLSSPFPGASPKPILNQPQPPMQYSTKPQMLTNPSAMLAAAAAMSSYAPPPPPALDQRQRAPSLPSSYKRPHESSSGHQPPSGSGSGAPPPPPPSHMSAYIPGYKPGLHPPPPPHPFGAGLPPSVMSGAGDPHHPSHHPHAAHLPYYFVQSMAAAAQNHSAFLNPNSK